MNEEAIKELLQSNQANFQKVFVLLDTLLSGLSNLEARVATLEAKDAITGPLWQELRADQQRIFERLDKIDAHLQAQDEKIVRLEEKMEAGFRKLGDKLDHLTLDYYDLHADVVDLQRRVTRLEPVN